jgi:hypothetical protein
MSTITFTHRARLSLLVTALVVGVSLASLGTVQAQVFQADHLKCYRVIDDSNPRRTNTVIMRTPQFDSNQQCTVRSRASYLCTETSKRRVNGEPQDEDPRGGRAGDYLCYRLNCPDNPIRNMLVDDQFNVPANRLIRIENAPLFCAPANKQVLPNAAVESEELEELEELAE